MTSSHDDFTNWVRPHLLDGTASLRIAGAAPAAYAAAQQAPADFQMTATVTKTIAAGASLDIPIAVPSASGLAINLTAPPAIAATLLDPNGQIADSSPANDPHTIELFRGLNADAPVAGSWTLRLTNSGQLTAQAMAAVLVAGSALRAEISASAPDDAGRVSITTRMVDGGQTAPGTTPRVYLAGADGARRELTLYDDGTHGDGAGSDGVYGTTTGHLEDGAYGAVVESRLGDETRLAAAVFVVGSLADTSRVYLPIVLR